MQRYIPIFLIVCGCAGILVTVSKLIKQIRDHAKGGVYPEPIAKRVIDAILGLFALAWFIAGALTLLFFVV